VFDIFILKETSIVEEHLILINGKYKMGVRPIHVGVVTCAAARPARVP